MIYHQISFQKLYLVCLLNCMYFLKVLYVPNHISLAFFIFQSQPSVSKWSFGSGEGSWQGRGRVIKDRTGHLYNNSEMSDILVNACDENWWFGDTVKDFNAHKFLLGTASPVIIRDFLPYSV